MKKGKADKLGLVRIYGENIFDIPVYVATNGKVRVRASTRKALQASMEQEEGTKQGELGEGWTIFPAFVRVNIETREIEYDRVED